MEPPAPDAPEPHATPGGTFEQLLAGMTHLDTLALQGVGLNGQSALRVFSTVVPTLVHLQDLWLHDNQLEVAPAMVLARQLPALRRVELSEGNDLLEPVDGVPGTIADLNRISGREIFQ